MSDDRAARLIRVRGTVQGVGFRPFVFRLAHTHGLCGWVLNGEDGVQIHVEGRLEALDEFIGDLARRTPPAARIASIEVEAVASGAFGTFEIRSSSRSGRPTVRISPDLAVCDACLAEMFAPADRRYRYPYINCTDCGPRFSIVLGLPYDRPLTTMREWPMCAACAAEYENPLDRRFHAQPIACPVCGPRYRLSTGDAVMQDGFDAVESAARLLREGAIVAVKGLGGYHLACDAAQAPAVRALRERKYRKEKPFAVMARDLDVARAVVVLDADAEALAQSVARPIVLAPARVDFAGVAPDNPDLGVMLPYTPLHYLLFAAGAPEVIVMTSGNVSSEPIAYEDEDAHERLAGIADAYLAGERPIARRLDDSVVRVGALGPVVLRRARGYAPSVVARLPLAGPVLAVGADLKNSVTLVVDGQALVGQHVGDLEHYSAYQAFQGTIRDLVTMYDVRWSELTVVHDLHPQYASTCHAQSLGAKLVVGVQHHRAHVASVVAERGALDAQVLGVAFDGTGYGDDGTIWGGEFFLGSVRGGLQRVAHLRRAALPGGDAAARYPVQAAAGFLFDPGNGPTPSDLAGPPFGFPDRYARARQLVEKNVRTFTTTSVGRLFDTVAALLGFIRPVTFEGQAAIWLEHLARTALGANAAPECPVPFDGEELDFRPALAAVIDARRAGVAAAPVARAFHRGLARGVVNAVTALREAHAFEAVVLSGGVFQNELLVSDVKTMLEASPKSRALPLWINHEVPPNDGGISLGQAALAIQLDEPRGSTGAHL